MKRVLVCFAAALLLLCFAAQAQAAEHIVRYYYINYCEACTPEEDFCGRIPQPDGSELGGLRLSRIQCRARRRTDGAA
jgi:hypothetical protein